jgi:hypothetical protein
MNPTYYAVIASYKDFHSISVEYIFTDRREAMKTIYAGKKAIAFNPECGTKDYSLYRISEDLETRKVFDERERCEHASMKESVVYIYETHEKLVEALNNDEELVVVVYCPGRIRALLSAPFAFLV